MEDRRDESYRWWVVSEFVRPKDDERARHLWLRGAAYYDDCAPNRDGVFGEERQRFDDAQE